MYSQNPMDYHSLKWSSLLRRYRRVSSLTLSIKVSPSLVIVKHEPDKVFVIEMPKFYFSMA